MDSADFNPFVDEPALCWFFNPFNEYSTPSWRTPIIFRAYRGDDPDFTPPSLPPTDANEARNALECHLTRRPYQCCWTSFTNSTRWAAWHASRVHGEYGRAPVIIAAISTEKLRGNGALFWVPKIRADFKLDLSHYFPDDGASMLENEIHEASNHTLHASIRL